MSIIVKEPVYHAIGNFTQKRFVFKRAKADHDSMKNGKCGNRAGSQGRCNY
jgi:hypothetical protein